MPTALDQQARNLKSSGPMYWSLPQRIDSASRRPSQAAPASYLVRK
jgi:hypothetical protein